MIFNKHCLITLLYLDVLDIFVVDIVNSNYLNIMYCFVVHFEILECKQ